MIRSFRDRQAERGFRRERVKLAHDVRRATLRKLLLLDAAESLDDSRAPPGNRLETLSGDRKGRHGIRIDERRRVCSRWRDGDAHDVEITEMTTPDLDERAYASRGPS